MAMMAMTTSNSINVNARKDLRSILMSAPIKKREGKSDTIRRRLLSIHFNFEVVRLRLDIESQRLDSFALGGIGVVDRDEHVVRADNRAVVTRERAQLEVAVRVGERGAGLAGLQLRIRAGRRERDGC